MTQEDKETAFRVRNLKDQIKRNNEQFIKNQQEHQQHQQAKTQHKNASGGNTGAGAGAGGKHFYSNDPNAYKPHEHLSDYFKKNNIEFDLKGAEKPVHLNVPEFYKGFARFNSYSWGIAAAMGLVCYGTVKLIQRVSKSKEQEQEQKI